MKTRKPTQCQTFFFVLLDLHPLLLFEFKLKESFRYAISVARKIGCLVFLLWEDIVEVCPTIPSPQSFNCSKIFIFLPEILYFCR
jgi:hypothetical protein